MRVLPRGTNEDTGTAAPSMARPRVGGRRRGPVLGWRRTWAGLALGLGGTGAVLLLDLLPEHPPPLVPGLVLMLVVVLASSVGGLWPGILTALGAFVALDYFFIPPRHVLVPQHFTGHGRASSIAALGVFLAVAVAVVTLIHRAATARVRAVSAGDRLRFLLEVSEVMTSSLDVRATLPRVVRLSVPTVADWCAAYLASPDGAIEELEVAAADRGVREMREAQPVDPTARVGIPEVVRTGRSELYVRVPRAVRDALTDRQGGLRLLRRDRLRSYLAVPLRARDRTVGALAMATGGSRRRFGRQDLELAEDIGRRAAIAMENARLYEERDHVARTLQRGLLPPRLPEIPGLELASRYRAAVAGAEVGGDFFDVFEIGTGTWGVVIGDVSGKGPEAAAVTGLARHTIRALAAREPEPSRVLAALNERLLHEETVDRFVTVCYVRVDEATRFTVASGGHPAPVVIRAGGEVEPVGGHGTLLGIFPDPVLTDRTLVLGPGEALVLYTDGVTEAFGRESLDHGPLAELLGGLAGEGATEIADRLEQAVAPPGVSQRDDVCIVVVRVLPRQQSDVAATQAADAPAPVSTDTAAPDAPAPAS